MFETQNKKVTEAGQTSRALVATVDRERDLAAVVVWPVFVNILRLIRNAPPKGAFLLCGLGVAPTTSRDSWSHRHAMCRALTPWQSCRSLRLFASYGAGWSLGRQMGLANYARGGNTWDSSSITSRPTS